MDDWVWWLVAAVVLAAGEIATTSFFLGPFAAGALVASFASLAGAGVTTAWVLFFAVTGLLFILVRPIARRHMRQPASVRTGTAALLGRPAQVLERIANREGTGIVKLEGEVWTARAFDEDVVYEPGDRVEVVEIRGATAVVAGEL